MADPDRITGRAPVVWSGGPAVDVRTFASTTRLAEDPMLVDVWGARLARLAIEVTTIGSTGTTRVRTAAERARRKAFLGGAR